MGDLDFAALRRAEVGSRLRVTRERLGMSLDDIQLATRVPARHLEALERGDMSGLPSPAYATGFVRAYARQLGLDPNALVRVYRGEAEEEPVIAAAVTSEPLPVQLPVLVREEPSRDLPRTPLLVAGALLVLLLLLGVALLVRRPPPASASIVLPPLQPATGAPAQHVVLPAARGEQVSITAKERTWMRVYEPGGRTLFSGILAPGGSYQVPDDARDPRISTGNPGGLAITVGGAPVVGLAGRQSVSSTRLSPAALRAPPREEARKDTGHRERRSRRRRSGGETSSARTEGLPPLAVTTEDARPTVSTPLGNAQ